MNHSFPWLFPDSLEIPWLFPDFLMFSQNSLTFPWLEKVVSFFQVFQCRWEPCVECEVSHINILLLNAWEFKLKTCHVTCAKKCGGWFWTSYVSSFAIQPEPFRLPWKDQIVRWYHAITVEQMVAGVTFLNTYSNVELNWIHKSQDATKVFEFFKSILTVWMQNSPMGLVRFTY